jgi:hypothetical protein
MNYLERCHRELISRFPGQIEPLSVWKAAEAHRMYWKPSRVRTLLLAESHVFTTEEESKTEINLAGHTTENIPTNFIKLIYCLGYGEPLLLPAGNIIKNRGTPQFWKIFYSCIHRVEQNLAFAPVRVSGTKNRAELIHNKLNLLNDLKCNGVWLLDASLAALYINGNKPPAKMLQTCITVSWLYIKKLIEQENPDRIIVIGKGVGRALQAQLRQLHIEFYVTPQPQARLSSEEHLQNFQRYYDLTHDRSSQSPCSQARITNTAKKEAASKVPPGSISSRKPKRWTLNDEIHSHYTSAVNLSETPLEVELWFKTDRKAQKKRIGMCSLDLPKLLESSYIRYDPAGQVSTKVRVRIVHLKGEQFGLKINNSGPLMLLNLE